MDTYLQFLLVVGTIAVVILFTILLFHHRYQKTLLPNNPRSKSTWKILLFSGVKSTICLLFVAFTAYKSVPQRERFVPKLLGMDVCLHILLENPAFSWFDHEETWFGCFLLSVLIGAFLGFGTCTMFVVFSFLNLRNMQQQMSDQSKRMHRFFIKCLVLQVLLPYSLIIIPAAVIISLVFFNILGSQRIGEICFLVISSHGSASSLSIIILNAPYRKYCKNIIFFKLFQQPSGTLQKKTSAVARTAPK